VSARDQQPPVSGLLSGELDAAAFERLLERAERDPAVSAELDLVADLAAAAELERERLLASVPPRRGRAEHGARTGAGGRSPRRWLAVAAALAAGVLALIVFGPFGGPRGPARVELAALGAAAPPPFVASELRSAGSALADEFSAAMRPYAAGDWAAADGALTDFLAAHPEHGPARLYRGAARAELGQLARALEDFEAVAATATGFLGEHARWRAALIDLLREDAAAARARLELLRDDGGAFAPNATALLERLEGR